MRLILIRHYRTCFNNSGQILGWGDAPRVDSWLDDMTVVETVMRKHQVQPNTIISSALNRSRQTARYFASRITPDLVKVTPSLNEVNYGKLYGKSKQWVSEHYPQHKIDPGFVYPGGESFNQMKLRSVEFVKSLAAKCDEQTYLCIVHAGVIRALISHFHQLDYTQQLTRSVSHRFVGVLYFDAGSFTRYEEWASPSGFIADGVLQPPATP